jgi:hypothetical protein
MDGWMDHNIMVLYILLWDPLIRPSAVLKLTSV